MRDQPRQPAQKPVEVAGVILGIAAAGLVPWIAYLALRLPASHGAPHWRLVWIGFDVLLAASLVTTAGAAVRQAGWLGQAASVTATLLVVDVWFDTLTAASGSELAVAGAEAALAELPMAALCIWLAVRGAKQLRLRPSHRARTSRPSHLSLVIADSASAEPEHARLRTGS